MSRSTAIAIKARVRIDDPRLDSVVGLWPGADLPEREVLRHVRRRVRRPPDLRRILMPEDYEGFPQRRDFPVGGEPVLFTHNEHRTTGGDSDDAQLSDYRKREESITLGDARSSPGMGETHELLTLNIGPHHPATHGVLRLIATLEGEVVRDIKPIIGYVHTGIEKTAEQKAYWKVIPVVERMDYLSYYFNAMAFCGAVETLLGIEVPPRAQYLRVIHLELNRIMSHLVWLGTSALDLGAMSMFWYCFRERETILDLFEMSSGQRMHTRYFQVGGVIEDIPVGFAEKVQRVRRRDADPRRPVRRPAREERDPALSGCAAPARSTSRRCWGSSVTGPLLRAAGIPWDLRKAAPYSSYDQFDFKIPIGTEGDNYDRFRVRHAELYESVKIIEQALDGLPEGPHITPTARSRCRRATSSRPDGGADPPLQARHRGLPRPARRDLLPDRVDRAASSAASFAPTARPSRRACTCATPASSTCRRLADGQGRLHRRPDRDAGDAGPDPRRHRPMRRPVITEQASAGQARFGHGSRVPGWDDAVDLTKPPATSRTRRRRPCRGAPQDDRRGDAEVPRSPFGLDPRAARGAGDARLVLARGDQAGRGGDAADARVPHLGGDLLRHARDRAQARNDVFVCTNISCSLRGADELYEAMLVAAAENPDVDVRSFECLGACDIAPMASVNGEYIGPLTPMTPARSSSGLERRAGAAGQAAQPPPVRRHRHRPKHLCSRTSTSRG